MLVTGRVMPLETDVLSSGVIALVPMAEDITLLGIGLGVPRSDIPVPPTPPEVV